MDSVRQEKQEMEKLLKRKKELILREEEEEVKHPQREVSALDRLGQGCQTHFSSRAAWSKSILTRAGLQISFLKKSRSKKILKMYTSQAILVILTLQIKMQGHFCFIKSPIFASLPDIDMSATY